MSPVRTGLENLLTALQGGLVGGLVDVPGDVPVVASMLTAGARCGLVSNPASVTRRLEDAPTALLAAGIRVASLFGPEHGARGSAAAGEAVGSTIDARAGLPVHSLYGATTSPTQEMLRGLDVVLFDLQDIGARFYTYIWTLAGVVEACAEARIPVVVLDRPNPQGGIRVEGPSVESEFKSFVGRHPIPVLHGMTLGEMAHFLAGRFYPTARVMVAGMSGWNRSMSWASTGLDWAAPSPNMPTAETALIYPGFCLLEGTNLSEGRGTASPFKVVGAPWIDPDKLRLRLEERGPSRWRAVHFIPDSSKHAGKLCGGVEWYPPQNPDWLEQFEPLRTGLEVIAAIRDLWPEETRWRQSPSGRSHFDLLAGGPRIRLALDAGQSAEQIARSWRPFEAEFRKSRAPYLLYE